MRETWQRQRKDPAYQFETPLPAKARAGKAAGGKAAADALASSLGNLAPKELEKE